MAFVLLDTADLALFSDLTRRVTIPHLTALTPTRVYEGVSVRFAGDEFPTSFRGEGRSRTFVLSCRYGASEQADAGVLLDMIDEAQNAVDDRLFLRTHAGQAAGLDAALAVVVRQVDAVPTAGLVLDVTLTCEAVQFSLAV